ncbi:MAG: DUF1816 domain-containing protein [Elainellaceae cyanobacterium]
MWTSLLQALGLAWWVEIKTEQPQCTYYFGPFASSSEAEAARGGYVEDLEKENAQGIRVSIRRGKPDQLTIFDESSEADEGSSRTPAFTM